MDFLFVTGMSGAGKTVAVNELEDMGYFCVGDIPSGLMGAFARLCEQSPVGGRIALVTDFRSGKEKAFGFLVGQVMRELKGKADPKLVNELLHRVLQGS